MVGPLLTQNMRHHTISQKVTEMHCLNTSAEQEIVFKKDKATLHVISKRCEDTVIIPIKLEGNPMTLIYIARYADE